MVWQIKTRLSETRSPHLNDVTLAGCTKSHELVGHSIYIPFTRQQRAYINTVFPRVDIWSTCLVITVCYATIVFGVFLVPVLLY